MREKALERQQRREQEVRKIEQRAVDTAAWNAWFEQKLNATLADKENCAFIEVVGQFVGENNQKLRKDYEAKIATLETRLKDLEQQKSLEARFLELERRPDARQHDCSQGCPFAFDRQQPRPGAYPRFGCS